MYRPYGSVKFLNDLKLSSETIDFCKSETIGDIKSKVNNREVFQDRYSLYRLTTKYEQLKSIVFPNGFLEKCREAVESKTNYQESRW